MKLKNVCDGAFNDAENYFRKAISEVSMEQATTAFEKAMEDIKHKALEGLKAIEIDSGINGDHPYRTEVRDKLVKLIDQEIGVKK